jgi:hypothetical protein
MVYAHELTKTLMYAGPVTDMVLFCSLCCFLHAGIPSMVYAHELTNTLMYAGPVTDMVAAISDLPAGGQVGAHS